MLKLNGERPYYDPVFYIQLHMICAKIAICHGSRRTMTGLGELVEHFRQVQRTLGRLFHAGCTGGMGHHRTGQQGDE